MIAMRVLSIALILLMVATIFAPSVSADANNTAVTYVNLEPQYYDTTSRRVNIVDEKNITKEETDVRQGLPQTIEGKYWGPYLQSSLFKFNKQGGYFQIAQNFTIPSSEIMNGVTELWLRIPVVSSQYDSYHVFIDWDPMVDAIALGYADNNPITPVTGLITHTVVPWAVTGSQFYWGYEYPGNYFSVDSDITQEIYKSEKGLYLHLRGIFLPDQQFTISFTGHLKATAGGPQVYLTQELLPTQDNYSYYFFDSKTIEGVWQEFKYYNSQVLQLMPAWAFIFVSGMGKQGMSAFDLGFKNDADHRDYLEYSFYFLETTERANLTANPWITFYIPFSVDTITNSTESSMQWDVNITIETTGGIALSLFFNDGSGTPVYSIEFNVTSNVDYFLCSVPLPLAFDPAPGAIFWGHLDIRLMPHEPSAVRFLAYLPDYSAPSPPFISINKYQWTFANYRHGGYLATDPPYFDGYEVSPGGYVYTDRPKYALPVVNNANYLPIAISRSMSAAPIASVNATDAMTVYDFGWGKGYSYPGATNIYMFLENGTSFQYHGAYKDFGESWDQTFADWIAFMTSIPGLVWGSIMDGITSIWNAVKAVGEWVYNIITELIDWIVSIIMDIANKVYDVMVGITYGLPIILTLFIVSYTGSVLTTGRIGKATKERRLLKKVTRKLTTHTEAFKRRERSLKEVERSDRARVARQRQENIRMQSIHRENIKRQRSADTKMNDVYARDRETRRRKP